MNWRTLFQSMALLTLALIPALPQSAEAANTSAGTVITNTATVNFSVGGVPQTAVTNGTSFTVDRKVNLTVTTLSNPSSVPSSTFQAVQFLVTNTSNTSIRTALTTSTSLATGWTNTYSLSNVAVYRDNGTTPGAYDSGDTLYANPGTFGDIASGGTLTILIVGDVPAGAVNGAQIKIALVATAAEPSFSTLGAPNSVIAQTAGADTAGVDTVYADTTGGTANDGATGDASRDGRHSAAGTVTVSTASMGVTKTSSVYSDPSNGTTNAKAIPGSVVLYTVRIANSGAQQATNVVITDDMSGMAATIVPNETTYDDTALTNHAPTACANGWAFSTNSTTGLDGTWACGAVAGWAAGKLTVNAGSINSGSSYWIRYQATIQ